MDENKKIDLKEIDFKILTKHVIKYKFNYVFGIFFLIIINILQVKIPELTGRIVDTIKTSNFKIQDITNLLLFNTKELTNGIQNLQNSIAFINSVKIIVSTIINCFSTIILLSVFIFMSRFLWRHYLSNAGRKIQKAIREELYAHIVFLDDKFFKKSKIGDLMANFTNDLQSIREASVIGVVSLVDALFTTLFVLLKLIKIDPILTLKLLAPYPIIGIIFAIAIKLSNKMYIREKQLFGNISQQVQETFSGIRVIKTFTREDFFKNKFKTVNETLMKLLFKINIMWSIIWAIIALFMGIITLILIRFGGIMIIENTLTIGQFSAIFAYLGMLLWPMLAIGVVIGNFQKGMAGLHRISLVMNQKSELIESKNAIDKKLEGKVEIKNLSFKYFDGREEVLNDISFSINKGEFLGILGSTASGKSTLIKLLTRIIELESGQILYDGIDIKDYKIKNIRKEVGVVPQNSFLFSNTIMNNITFAVDKDKIDESLTKHICDITTITRDINLFEKGFETEVGERGVSLSGGQKQRVALSRALLLNPNILILDDSMSAVDTETEEKILKEVLNYRKGKTTIIISNRISTLANTDKVIVLKDGKLAQEGTHEELMKIEGFYKEIYELQKLDEKKK